MRWLLHRLRAANRVEARNVAMMLIGVMAVILLNTFGQLRLNAWQGAFYNALEQHRTADVLTQVELFLMIVGMLLALVVAQTWLTETMKVRARLWLTRHLLECWLAPRRAYLLGFAGDIARNPDQRIGQDASLLTDSSISFAIGLGQATMLLVSFMGVLWQLSELVVFNYNGSTFTIPGYMVWCVLLFTAIGSFLTYVVGRPLIAINAQRYANEGTFRGRLMDVNKAADAIALERGEADELAGTAQTYNLLTVTLQALANARARLTWITSGYGWLGLIAPIAVAAPGYLGGHLSWGGLFMVVNGFNQVQNSLRWFIDNYAGIAEWQANLQRVAALLQALDEEEDENQNLSHIVRREGPPGELTIDNLAVCLPGDLSTCILVEEHHISVKAGERLRFLGAPGTGKTTLFMALAGLWPWGRGTIATPASANMMFVPERPYIPAGTLRAAIAYPLPANALPDDRVKEAMQATGLGHLVQELDLANGWTKDLSLGDQQRLGLARLIVHRPDWIVGDDFLSSLMPSDKTKLLGLLAARLPDTGIIATSHGGNGGGEFYHRTIELGGVASLPPFTLANGVINRDGGRT